MATRTINNPTDLDKAVARLGRLISWVTNEEARRQRSINYHQSKIDKRKIASHTKTRGWEAERDELAVEIFNYADTNKSTLLKKGQNFFKAATGRVGWDQARAGATEFPKGEDEAVKAIEKHLTEEQADRILKKEVRKNELKALIREEPEIAGKLADVIDIPLVDRLVIDPDNSHQQFRQPISWFHKLLEARAV